MLPRHNNESHNFDCQARQTERRLRRKRVKQPDGRNSDEPASRHEEKTRKFQINPPTLVSWQSAPIRRHYASLTFP